MLFTSPGSNISNWNKNEANASVPSNSQSNSSYVIPVPIIVFLLVVILVVSWLGNSVVALVIARKRKMRSFTNCLILNLAVADLTVTLVCIPPEIPLEMNNFRWIYGDFFCSLYYPLQTATIFASAFTLVLLSCSRYWAIIHPFKKQPNLMAARGFVFIIWMSSVILVVPYMMGLDYVQEYESCEEVWNPSERHAYTIIALLFQCVIPLLLIVITSLQIVFEMAVKKSCTPKDRKRDKENKKLVKLLAAISATFALCCIPTHIITFLVEFDNGNELRYIEEMKVAACILLYSNSALNPVIYNIFSSNFRNGLVEMFRGILSVRKSKRHNRKPKTLLSRAGTGSTNIKIEIGHQTEL